MKRPSSQTWLLAVVLFGMLVAAAWAAISAWMSMDAAGGGGQISWQGIVALVVGAIGTLVVGVGLMALVFYSSRHRYDEQPRHDPVNPPASGKQPPDRAP